jgi:hypothetical protein
MSAPIQSGGFLIIGIAADCSDAATRALRETFICPTGLRPIDNIIRMNCRVKCSCFKALRHSIDTREGRINHRTFYGLAWP